MRILSGKTLYVASGLKRLLWPNRHQRGLSAPKTHFLTIFFIGRRRPSFPVFRVNVDPVPQALVRTIQHQGWRQLWASLNTSTLKSTSQSIPTQSDQGHRCPCAIYIRVFKTPVFLLIRSISFTDVDDDSPPSALSVPAKPFVTPRPHPNRV